VWEFACGAHVLGLSGSSDPGQVTCFACRRTNEFKAAQLERDPVPIGRILDDLFPKEFGEGVGVPTPRLHTPPYMNDRGDGVFLFHDKHIEGCSMEVVPQTTGNVEITVAYGPDDGYLFTLNLFDRADLLRALLHEFHYGPEVGGPGDDQD
jgi:hypothetical protein